MESRTIKILAVDDNPDNLITIKALIGDAFPGFRILTALNGLKGLELALHEEPDVVLLDVIMPGMDGFEVCQRVKADVKLRDIPVVFVTAIKDDKEIRIKALECGADAFLTKPVDRSELIAQIRAMVRIRTANIEKNTEKERLSTLVIKRTSELNENHLATIKLLEDLKTENEARKRSEEALRGNDARYGKMFSNIGDVIVIFDENGIKKYNSPNIKKWFGWRPEEVIGSSIWEYVHPGDLDAMEKVYNRLLSGSNLTGYVECRFRCKNKSYEWIHLTLVNLLHDPDIHGILGNYHQITERRQVEQKLLYLTRLYALLGQINQAIVRIRNIEDLFRAICNVAIEFGQFRMAWVGLIDERDKQVKPFVFAGVEDGYLSQIYPENENIPVGKGPSGLAYNLGKIVTCNDIAAEPRMLPWRDEALVRGYRSSVAVPFRRKGKIFGTLNLYAQETDFFNEEEQKLLQEIGEDITFALDAMTSETERREAELELKSAKEKAEESDRLKSAFLANMSHEIRTPMNGILGFAGLLKEPKLTGEEQQEYIRIIEKSGVRMLNIINDIITISKVESGQMKILIAQTNVNDQVGYIFNFFKPEAELKGLQLIYKKSLPDHEANIKTDREKLYAILTNLVKNSIKYSDSGTIEFGYHVKTDRAPAEFEFYVKDTGIGIPDNRQKAIFDRFVQADIGDVRAFQGAGLGLSISKAYVEMLGGKIWVESELGKGSVFYFTIPVNSARKGKNRPQNESFDVDPENQIKGLKILIAEDDEISGMLLTLGVKTFGKVILKARTGIEAVELCKNNPDIDLILMDVKMPAMDGYEATKLIRQFNREVVIIAQTAYALTGDREKALAAGCNDYLAKPFGNTVLTEMLKNYF